MSFYLKKSNPVLWNDWLKWRAPKARELARLERRQRKIERDANVVEARRRLDLAINRKPTISKKEIEECRVAWMNAKAEGF